MSSAAVAPAGGPTRPSDARRKLLASELSVPLVSNFFPIARYYDAADKVHASFKQSVAFATKKGKVTRKNGSDDVVVVSQEQVDALDDAYVYGRRYCMFCLEAIPKHNYYSSDKFKYLKDKHYSQVDEVLKDLQYVSELMDEQEELKRMAFEREERARFEALRRRAQDATAMKAHGQNDGVDVEASALSKLEMLRPPAPATPLPPAPPLPPPSYDQIRRDPSGEEPAVPASATTTGAARPTSRYRLIDSSEEDSDGDDAAAAGAAAQTGGSLPPPMLPPSPQQPQAQPQQSQQPQQRPAQVNDSHADWGISSEEAAAAAAAAAPGAPPPYHQAVVSKNQQQRPRYHARTFLGPAASSERSLFGANNKRVHPMPEETEAAPSLSVRMPGEEGRDAAAAAAAAAAIKAKRRQEEQLRKPMRQLQREYREEYQRYQQTSRITVTGIGTYQGRLGQSTNGCTVISALTAAKHLSTASGVTDQAVEAIIDRQCGPLLREIRGKLGLDGSALIIPSDVHDHLVDKKILRQEDFVGAAGGNIMDPSHLGEFLKLLHLGEDGKGAHRRASATLFFREHVISIVKWPISNNGGGATAAYYDLYDSLPGIQSLGRTAATRTRCKDVQALLVLLRHYASRKFSDSNCRHIDRNPWHDSMADFDPRVFQGFVWARK